VGLEWHHCQSLLAHGADHPATAVTDVTADDRLPRLVQPPVQLLEHRPEDFQVEVEERVVVAELLVVDVQLSAVVLAHEDVARVLGEVRVKARRLERAGTDVDRDDVVVLERRRVGVRRGGRERTGRSRVRHKSERPHRHHQQGDDDLHECRGRNELLETLHFVLRSFPLTRSALATSKHCVDVKVLLPPKRYTGGRHNAPAPTNQLVFL